MSLSDYNGLTTAINTWLLRAGDTEISNNAADLVTLCNARLNRELSLRVAWSNTALSCGISTSTIPLPSDFIEAQSLFLTTFGINTKLGTFTAGEYEIGATNGVPSAWAIDGANIQLDLPCNQTHTFTFRYRQRFSLDSVTTTNWLLTNHPDVYLFSSLLEAESLQKDIGQQWIALWQARAKEAMDSIKVIQARSVTISKLRADEALLVPQGFNILTGQ